MKDFTNTSEKVKIGSIDKIERQSLIERMKNDLQFVNNKTVKYNMIKCICTWKNHSFCNIPREVNEAIQWLHKDKEVYRNLYE